MKVSSAPAHTSSRLNREAALPSALHAQEIAITEATIAYCHTALDRSRFFSLLRADAVTLPMMQYVFLQYRHWRDRLHQWFGLCIVKAGSCTDPAQKAALLSLADHIFTDLQDDHTEMYLEFLHELDLSEEEITSTQRSNATTAYESSFVETFGYGLHNFDEALAALSGRELCVSIRNTRILHAYFEPRCLPFPTWLSLHAELETNHFQDAIRPVLVGQVAEAAKHSSIMAAIRHSIDRHVQYFDDLLLEYETYTTVIESTISC